MKKREKFLCIFAVVVIIMLVIVIINNITDNKLLRGVIVKNSYFNHAISEDIKNGTLSETEMKDWYNNEFPDDEKIDKNKSVEYYNNFLAKKQYAQQEADVEIETFGEKALLHSIFSFVVYRDLMPQVNYVQNKVNIFIITLELLICSLYVTLILFLSTEIKYTNIKKYIRDVLFVLICLLIFNIINEWVLCYKNNIYEFSDYKIENLLSVIPAFLIFLLTNIQINLKKSFRVVLILTFIILLVFLVAGIIVAIENNMSFYEIVYCISLDKLNYLFISYIVALSVYLTSYGISVNIKKRKEKIKNGK